MLVQLNTVAIGLVELCCKVCNVAMLIASHLTSLYVCGLARMGSTIVEPVWCFVPLCGYLTIVQYFQAIQWYVEAAAVRVLQLRHIVGKLRMQGMLTYDFKAGCVVQGAALTCAYWCLSHVSGRWQYGMSLH